VTPSVNTTYVVQGTGTNGCENSAAVTVFVDECLGVGELKIKNEELKIYPNPNNGVFTIETQENTHIVVMNLIGQIIYEQNTTSSKTKISLKEIDNGIYFIKAGNRIGKIVKE
ncbi:MAG: T9SS type A sorting domain-containing protein, partial [Bacteroidetes bacterium]|nr:T9SS type A sorting domain-containing protein [Bacteroidota bacterium]